MKTRVLIVEDDRLFADVLVEQLREEGVTVVGIATDGNQGLVLVERERPDVVLLDLGLGHLDGFTVGREILAAHPSTKVVALTARRDRRALSEAQASGFHSYMTKDLPLPRFVTLLRRVLVGRSTAPPALAARSHRAGDPRFAFRQLSPRERDVLELLREGLSTEAIAEQLLVKRNTVRSHIQRILTKLQVHSRLEAVALMEKVHAPVSPATLKPASSGVRRA